MTEEKKLKLDVDIKRFADELKLCFSKEEIEEVARETGFVKRKSKIKHGNSFAYVALWM